MSEKKSAVKFTKQQFLKSANFTPVQRDVLGTILEDDKTYTVDQVCKLINDYAKRKVK